MLFTWWKNRRRRRLLSEPFPKQWDDILNYNLGHYPLLTKEQRERLQDFTRIFAAEKTWEGCKGLALTDEILVTISAAACLLILGLDIDYYRRVQTILVYPHGYMGEQVGGVFESRTPTLGEAHYRGPVILSWGQLQHDNQNLGSGENLAFHEFSHQLDMLTGEIDGTPPMPSQKIDERWASIMTKHYEELSRTAKLGLPTLLDVYGTENEAEFFAVCTECFFDRPVDMQIQHPDLYDVMDEFYCVNPSEWFG